MNAYFCIASSLTFWHLLISINISQHTDLDTPLRPPCLVQLLDSIYHAADNGKATLLFSLDISTAFDTIDHSILLHSLAHNFGLTGFALTGVQSYLTGRSQLVVQIGCHSSNPSTCLAGVPQGYVLGPLFFIYTSPIAHTAQALGIQQQQYADDTQLYVAISPNSMVTHACFCSRILFRITTSLVLC